jgi:hypothetical protein
MRRVERKLNCAQQLDHVIHHDGKQEILGDTYLQQNLDFLPSRSTLSGANETN